jgi:hypothetical protein
VLAPQPAVAPLPCGGSTGFAGGESAIAVTNNGTVLYAPAVQTYAGIQTQYFLGGGSGFARTVDGGHSWSFVDPISFDLEIDTVAGRPGYPAWDQIDDKFFMDRRTGRLFWADPDLPSEVVVWSDDDGISWGYSLMPVGFGGEWTQITAARPRTSTTGGYPEVVYACGEYDSLARDVSYQFEGDLCQKSLDGGQTWIFAGQGLFGSPSAHDPQCVGQPEHPNFSPWAAPDPQGRLYELMFCAGHTYLLRSADEGGSWTVAARVPYSIPAVGPGGTGAAELRSDADGNLYLAWSAAGNPNPNGPYKPGAVELATSRDLGRSWSPPLSVLAPGVSGIRTHFGFDVGAPGHVVVSYLGQRSGRPGFDGYITETADALDGEPVFWSGVVNDLSQPPLDSGGKGSSNGMGLDYTSAMIGPDGTAWASFWDACAEDLPQPSGCPASRRSASATTLGFGDFAGSMQAPPPAAAPVPRAARRCTIVLHHRRGERITRVVVRSGRHVVRVVRGRNITRVKLHSRARVTLTIEIVTRHGRHTRRTHMFKRCLG